MNKILSFNLLLITVSFSYSQVTETFDGVTISGSSFTTTSGLSFTTSDTFESYGTDLQDGGVTLTAPIPHIFLDQSESYFEFTPTSTDKLLSSLSFDLWYSNSNSGTTLACECKSYDSSGNLLETITKDVIAKAYNFSGTPKKVRCNITEINPGNAVFFDDLTFTLLDESNTPENVPFSFNSTNPLGIESIFSNNSTGNYSFSVGISNTASGEHSTALGQVANATGLSSLASGYDTTASGAYSSAFGQSTTASGSHSSAFGNLSTATAFTSFSAGSDSHANGAASIALGNGANAQNDYAVAIGHGATTTAESSVALGYNVTASGAASTALGNGTISSGDNAFSSGIGTTASGDFSTAMGINTTASGQGSTAFGTSNEAQTDYSIAAGYGNTSSGYAAVTFGFMNTTSGQQAFSVGTGNTASGNQSIAIGSGNTSSGIVSTALGSSTTSTGKYATSAGKGTISSGFGSMAIGTYNIENSSDSVELYDASNTAFVIGNGADNDNRSDALVVKFDGTTTIAGDLNINSDAKLKANIISLGSTLAKLLQIEGKTYTLKKDTNQKQKIGLLAQDIEKVFPELVSENNGIKSVNYQGLVPVLINALKDQQSEIDELKSMVQELINKN